MVGSSQRAIPGGKVQDAAMAVAMTLPPANKSFRRHLRAICWMGVTGRCFCRCCLQGAVSGRNANNGRGLKSLEWPGGAVYGLPAVPFPVVEWA